MKAMVLNEYGDNAEFQLTELPQPTVKAGHVVVRVAATSVNTVDTMIRQMGKNLPLSPDLPAVLGMDFASTIEAVGEGVTDFVLGDEVYGCAGGLADLQGTLAEYMLADAKLIAHKPKTLSMCEAAARAVWDMLPKPTTGKLPLLITGGSQQDPDWIARHGDGWITYPRGIAAQARIINDWRTGIDAVEGPTKPAVQSLYVDLTKDLQAPPQPIHPGFLLGTNHLRAYLKSLEEIGVNHVALNLRFNQADTEETMKRLADELLPDFSGPDIAE